MRFYWPAWPRPPRRLRRRRSPAAKRASCELRDLGAKFVGYTTRSGDNGSLDVLNPLFVQYLLPARRRHAHPIVFIHGGGGQGTDWLETPDGRDGWVDYFVADGWDVYVVDRPGHGRSQSNASCGNGMVRVGNSRDHLAALDFGADRLAGRCADADQRRSRRLDGELDDGAVLRRRARGGEDLRAARRDRSGRAARAFGGRRQHVPRAGAEPEKVVGIIGFEAAASNPVTAGFNNARR